MLHRELTRAAEDFMQYGKSGADRKSRVTRGRLHVHALKWRGGEDFCVRDAVEGDASRQAQRFLAGFGGQAPPARDQNLLERGLHAGGEVVVALGERFVHFARGAESFLKIRRKKTAEDRRAGCVAPGHFGALGLVDKIFEPQAEGMRSFGADDAAELVEKLRMAVG